ncbi:MAG: hypothetical protein IJ398_03285 [Clostridia bacterium]|nr:hypothetical protein [Clostridia bacterium]
MGDFCKNRALCFAKHCKICGEAFLENESILSLGNECFHYECITDNYSASELLELLGIFPLPFVPKNDALGGQITIGKYQNIVVSARFFEFFKKRFKCARDVINSLSEYKRIKGITFFDSDQSVLEKWALKKESFTR